MDIITTTEALEALCAELRSDPFITVDTEFMREQTYWPELCLIQIAGARREAIVDPLAPGIDLKPFFALMADEAVVKVFHAARQDVEIVYSMAGIIPKPMFDTQVAAMVCGFGDQASYEVLARKLARTQIDKSSRFTDWSRRPLSQKQLAYALSDVTHLRVIYKKLKADLDASGREGWLEEEMAQLASPKTYRTEPGDAWKRLKFRPKNRRQLGVLMAIAAWREREAQERNVPRNRVIKDDALIEVVVQAPSSPEAMRELRALPKGYANSRLGEGLLKAIRDGLAADQDQLPALAEDHAPLPEGTAAIVDILKLALKVVCDANGIAPKLVASSADIEAIAAGKDKQVPALHGWRRQLFGETALEIKAGHLAIGIRDGKSAIFPVSGPAQLAAE
ncbi:MAG: ribonuclease D [Hyphomicrobiales bacterium]